LERAPENTPQAFLVFCSVSALGRHVAGGDPTLLAALRVYASDSRWRIREAVATALQYLGDADVKALLLEAKKWGRGNWLEKRAAAAGICEPRLLKEAASARAVLKILDAITSSMVGAQERNTEPFRILRQGMGYCWSVAVAALPAAGKPLMEKWIAAPTLTSAGLRRRTSRRPGSPGWVPLGCDPSLPILLAEAPPTPRRAT
jgi:hypothetical protein